MRTKEELILCKDLQAFWKIAKMLTDLGTMQNVHSIYFKLAVILNRNRRTK